MAPRGSASGGSNKRHQGKARQARQAREASLWHRLHGLSRDFHKEPESHFARSAKISFCENPCLIRVICAKDLLTLLCLDFTSPALPPAEQLLDLGLGQLEERRPPMTARGSARRGLHLTQQRIHLGP